MRGRVNARGEAWFPLAICGLVEVSIEGLIDTGFDDFLSIPAALADRLGLVRVGTRVYELADGRAVRAAICLARVAFCGRKRKVPAVLADSEEVLIGTRMLRRYRLTIRYRHRSTRMELDR